MNILDLFKKNGGETNESILIIKRKNELLFEIENFISWCEKTEDVNTRAVKSLIEKMTSWYELRFLDADINKEFLCMLNNDTSDKYFYDIDFMEDYIKIATDDEKQNIINSFGLINWSDVFSAKQFISKLDYSEKQIFRPSFPNIVNINKKTENHVITSHQHLHLSKKGQVLGDFKNFSSQLRSLLCGNIKDVYQKLLESKYYSEEDLTEIKSAIEIYDKEVKVKNGVLNTVMYNLLVRGDSLIGPRRAFKFAKEFNLDIRIPFIFGLDSGCYGRKEFINKGLSLGLPKDTECYFNSYENGAYHTKVMTIEEILNHDLRIENIKKQRDENQEQKKEFKKRLVDLLKIQNEQMQYNSEISQDLIEQYTEKYIIGTQPMYQLNLEHYKKTKEKPRIDMLLWTFLIDHKEMLIKKDQECVGEFYYRNREVIDEGISNIIRDFNLSRGDLVPFNNRGFKNTGNKKYDDYYNLVWGCFGTGIEMTSWALTYADEKSVADIIRKYDEELYQETNEIKDQMLVKKPRILTKKIHFDELNRNNNNF